jgi:hypothetical protein
MVSDYHSLSKNDNANLGLGLDYGLVAAVLLTAMWYVFVPTFWEVAARGKEIGESFWLGWGPLVLVASGSVAAGVFGYFGGWPAAGLLAKKVRVLVLLGLGILAVLIPQRVQMILKFREEQTAYLDRCIRYVEEWSRRQRELLSVVDQHQGALGSFAPRSEVSPEIQAVAEALNDQLQAAREALANVHPAGRAQAAEIESGRAHDFRAQAILPDEYSRSVAKEKPGPELLGSAGGVDPSTRAETAVLGATIVESGLNTAGLADGG